MNNHSIFLCASITIISTLECFAMSLAQAQPDHGLCPALPGDASAWGEQEHWAWKAICEGLNADLQGKYGGSPDTRESQNWPAQRDLSPRFLETILTDDSYRMRIPRRGIVIVGARFREVVNLAHLRLDRDLFLLRSHFDELSLVGAEISGRVDLEHSSASKRVNMDSIHVGALSMNYVYFPSVWLAGARIDSQLSLNDSAIAGQVQMTNLDVGKDLYVLNSYLTEVILRSARIGGILSIAGPRSGGDPVCPNRTGPRPAFPSQSVDLTQATVGILNFGGVCYGPINGPENWGVGAHLTLTGASVRSLQDGLCRDTESECSVNTWPDHLELIGFTYQQLELFDAGKETDMAARPADWWLAWLKRQAKYSPEPYETLAATLSRLGHKEKAKDILYAGKNRELLEATPSTAGKIWLGLHWLLIGYGYRIYYALWWALAFVAAGVAVLRLSGEGKNNGMPYGIAYSIDMLLPIIRLRDAHYKIDLNGWARYYFYLHKTMGYVLASFLIAGLSGLTR